MMKLYKFRSLANCQDLTRAQKILETGKFWCSRYWQLNDPLEGVYEYKDGTIPNEDIRNLYINKSKYAICSFTGAKAFKDPLVWGYYANGFKGIAIKIEVEDNKNEVEDNRLIQITYSNEVPSINNNPALDPIQRILTTKLCCWKHEYEYRYLKNNSEPGNYRIGEIKALYYGKPYITKLCADLAKERSRIKEYLCRIETLKKTARINNIKCRQVKVINGKVKFR